MNVDCNLACVLHKTAILLSPWYVFCEIVTFIYPSFMFICTVPFIIIVFFFFLSFVTVAWSNKKNVTVACFYFFFLWLVWYLWFSKGVSAGTIRCLLILEVWNAGSMLIAVPKFKLLVDCIIFHISESFFLGSLGWLVMELMVIYVLHIQISAHFCCVFPGGLRVLKKFRT